VVIGGTETGDGDTEIWRLFRKVRPVTLKLLTCGCVPYLKGEFQLGYYDRIEGRIILVPLKEVTFPDESPQTFQFTDLEGQVHRIPFHRVREVYKDPQRIWHRGPVSAYS